MIWETIIKIKFTLVFDLYRSYKRFKEIGIFLPAKLLRETPSVEKPETKIGKKLDGLIDQKWREEYCIFENREENLLNALKRKKVVRVIGKRELGKLELKKWKGDSRKCI